MPPCPRSTAPKVRCEPRRDLAQLIQVSVLGGKAVKSLYKMAGPSAGRDSLTPDCCNAVSAAQRAWMSYRRRAPDACLWDAVFINRGADDTAGQEAA